MVTSPLTSLATLGGHQSGRQLGACLLLNKSYKNKRVATTTTKRDGVERGRGRESALSVVLTAVARRLAKDSSCVCVSVCCRVSCLRCCLAVLVVSAVVAAPGTGRGCCVGSTLACV